MYVRKDCIVDESSPALTSSTPRQDRSCAPSETLARLRPHFSKLGITRLADLTGLDDLGIPVAMAVRPNSHSLSLSLGKGADIESAMVSAAMEAAETAIAERVPENMAIMSAAEAARLPVSVLELDDLARCVTSEFDHDAPIGWVNGRNLVNDKMTMVPWALAGLDHRTQPQGYHDAFYVASDGLASGNTYEEAVFHALCELIERDALFAFQFANAETIAQNERSVDGDEHLLLPELLRLIEKSNLKLRLFAMENEFGLPAFMAVLEARHHKFRPGGDAARQCGGCGCHPDAGRAIVKAITEAAQARLALVAGARDDIGAVDYRSEESGEFTQNMAARPPRNRLRPAMSASARQFSQTSDMPTISQHIERLIRALRRADIRQAVAVPLAAKDCGIHVVRVIADRLQVPLEGPGVQITSRGFETMQEMAA